MGNKASETFVHMLPILDRQARQIVIDDEERNWSAYTQFPCFHQIYYPLTFCFATIVLASTTSLQGRISKVYISAEDETRLYTSKTAKLTCQCNIIIRATENGPRGYKKSRVLKEILHLASTQQLLATTGEKADTRSSKQVVTSI
ncbi:hypothetical protein J6590_076008 [Homalodisca vitripennis]|nr:hypothetical protein J6590_076008 [Homalodisca vitripennis]